MSLPAACKAGIPLLAAALALGLLGPASARTLAPRYGGTLVVGLSGGDPSTLDPTLNNTGTAGEIYSAMCQQLYIRDASQQLVPELAASVPAISKDKLSYTIQLRKGIQFNDGTPFNAQAVVTTAQRYMTYPGSVLAGRHETVDSITATGPYTVVYHLKARDSAFTAGGPVYVLSPTQLTKLGDNFGTEPVCVGPFMFDHRVVGDHVTLIKSPYYYDKKNVYLDKIVYKPMSSAPAATAALKAGDIQALDNVSTTELDGVRQTSSLQVISAPQLGWLGLFINIGNKNGQGNPPYAPNVGTPLSQSAKLRQAFEEAIDRKTLNKVVFGGLYQPSCTLIPPAYTGWFSATKVPCTPYDPKHAKKLVAESAFPNPTVHLLTATTTDRLRLAQFVQAQEAAVGINVVIDTTDDATVRARQASGNFDTSVGSRVPGGGDPSSIYASLATSGNLNRSGYSNTRMDYVLDNGLKATDPKARAVNYHVAQQIITSDRPYIVLNNPVTFAAFSTKLTGFQLTGNGLLTVANARYK